MPTLAEVLGSLIGDVLRARMAADALTVEAARAYRDDPLLASLSVPRVTISDLTVRLRFAVTDVREAERPPVVVERFTGDWNARVDRVLARIADRSDERRRAGIRRLREALRDEPVALDAQTLEQAVDGDVGPLVDLTVASVLERIRRLPREPQGQIGDPAVFRKELQALLAVEAPAFANEVRRRLTADQALRSDVVVEVSADELAGRPSQVVQQIEATLTQADLEEFVDTQAGRS